MKTVQQKLRWSGVIVSVALLALLFTSCTKHVDNTPTAPTSNLAVIDLSPGSPNLDFYLDGAKVNSNPISYGGGLIYFICYAGKRQAVFYQSGSTTTVASDSINLKASTAYSLLLSNLPTSPDVTLLRDSIFIPATGTAIVRVVNASPDAGGVDFAFKGQAPIATNITYRKYTAFIPVTLTSSFIDTLDVYKTGTSTILQKIPMSLQEEGVYTAYIYGFAAQTSGSEQLTSGAMENTYFY